jgi:hypothetical protein
VSIGDLALDKDKRPVLAVVPAAPPDA